MAYKPGLGSWNNKGSWKPSVRAPRDGQPCKHERHAQFALRSVLHHYDYMANMYARENGGERFAYIGMSYLLKHCKDIETKQPYSRRMLERCVAFAVEHGILTPAERYVAELGETRSGHVVADHAALSYIVGSRCVFCGANAAANAALNAAANAATNAAKSDERTPHIDAERTPHRNGANASDSTTYEHDDGNLPSAENRNLPRSKSLSSHCERSDGSEGSAIRPPDRSSVTDPARPQGIRVGALAWLTFEEQLDVLTDGEFQTTALEKYRGAGSLRTAVKRVIGDRADVLLNDRAVCKSLCELINGALLADGIMPPGGWVPVLKALRSGGVLRYQLPERKPSKPNKSDGYLTADEKRAIEEHNLEAMRAAGFSF